MNPKTKLIILAAILVIAPLVAYIIQPLNFTIGLSYIQIPLIPIATVVFAVLFAINLRRFNMGDLSIFYRFIKSGIYIYLVYFIFLVIADIYASMSMMMVEYGYWKKYLLNHFWVVNYPLLVLIGLMYSMISALITNQRLEKNLKNTN